MIDRKIINVRVDSPTVKSINSIAEKEDRTFSQVVRILLTEALEARKKKNK